MTTFQAFVYAVIHGVTEFIPASAKAHHILIAYLTGWPQPSGVLLGALTLGSFLALMIYFRHDWASMISSLIQVIIFRRRPMTMDEQMPLFILISSLPLLIAFSYFGENLSETGSALGVAALFAMLGLPLWFCDFIGRKSKGMADWNWLDALWIGLCQSLAVLPAYDFFTAALFCGFFLNYRREAAVKYAYFAAAPLLLAEAMTQLRELSLSAVTPMADLSWLSFGVALVVTMLTSLLVIGGFMKNIQQKSMGQYVAYRWLLAGAVCVVFWLRNR